MGVDCGCAEPQPGIRLCGFQLDGFRLCRFWLDESVPHETVPCESRSFDLQPRNPRSHSLSHTASVPAGSKFAQSSKPYSSVMPLPNISCNICSQLMPSASTWLIAVASGVGTL